MSRQHLFWISTAAAQLCENIPSSSPVCRWEYWSEGGSDSCPLNGILFPTLPAHRGEVLGRAASAAAPQPPPARPARNESLSVCLYVCLFGGATGAVFVSWESRPGCNQQAFSHFGKTCVPRQVASSGLGTIFRPLGPFGPQSRS